MYAGHMGSTVRRGEGRGGKGGGEGGERRGKRKEGREKLKGNSHVCWSHGKHSVAWLNVV